MSKTLPCVTSTPSPSGASTNRTPSCRRVCAFLCDSRLSFARPCFPFAQHVFEDSLCNAEAGLSQTGDGLWEIYQALADGVAQNADLAHDRQPKAW
jgi:hypothetical protein